MASSNPFRKSVSGGASASTATPSPTHHTQQDVHSRFPPLDALDTIRGDLPSTPTDDGRTKTMKKVRVLSPPPLSPDSPEWPNAAPPQATSAPSGYLYSKFNSSYKSSNMTTQPPTQNNTRAPPNPFSKTLKDLESTQKEQDLVQERREEGAALKAGTTARKSLDVDSFSRLLMTGKPTLDTPDESIFESPKGGTDSSSASQLSVPVTSDHSQMSLGAQRNEFDEEDVSDSSLSVQNASNKKPPPPPSSRHGKSIRPKHGDDYEYGFNDVHGEFTNSPSPLAAPTSTENPIDSLSHDIERPVDSKQRVSQSNKKAVPAPPPRRGHSRGESKVNTTHHSGLSQSVSKVHEDDEPPSRSSLESLRSKSDHRRSESHAPAPPPPPRRPHGSNRLSAHFGSSTPENMSSIDIPPAKQLSPSPGPEGFATSTPVEYSPLRELPAGNSKLSAPPPPPTRNTSVRRPASVRSMDSTSRRVSNESKPHGGTAPPPPPRRRGNSQLSVETPTKRTSIDSAGSRVGLGLSEEPSAIPEPNSSSLQSPSVPDHSVEILADLDALQREVDALRGVGR